MDWTGRRIEIFIPFGEAFELMEKILLRPFEIGKWFVIGFTAWLATFFGGFLFNYRRHLGDPDWPRRLEHYRPSLENLPPWVLPVAICGGLLLLGLIVLFAWLNSRGRFMFTDCIVHNRGAIVAPWKEFRTEANRYFLFRILVSLCGLVVFGGLAAAACFSLSNHRTVPIVVTILLALIFVFILIVIGVIMVFMVPVMYRQRCTAIGAFRQVWSLIKARPGVFVLFCLFYLLLYIGGAMVSCLVTCATCCLTTIPYLGTVILLPIVMVLYTFPLCFLRQFGDAYDVWAGVPPGESSLVVLAPVITPTQEPPSPPAPPPPEPPILPPAAPPPSEPPPLPPGSP